MVTISIRNNKFALYFWSRIEDFYDIYWLFLNFKLQTTTQQKVHAFLKFKIGDQDYQLSPEEVQRWAQITAEFDNTPIQQQTLIQENSEYIPGVVGDVVDLSNHAGVYSYTVKDSDGNIVETETGDHLSQKLKDAYLEMIKKVQDSKSKNLSGQQPVLRFLIDALSNKKFHLSIILFYLYFLLYFFCFFSFYFLQQYYK